MANNDDPIAITGYAVETPNDIETSHGLWQLLAAGQEGLSPFPHDRSWPLAQLDALADKPGWNAVCNSGGFLTGAALFDPVFFGISPREAIAMEPQQRVALRVAWRAVENTGIDPHSLTDQELGCFIGASVTEYGPRADQCHQYSGHRVTGTAMGAISGRISYHLGITGPCMTVDTACSSTLTALSLAMKAIESEECDAALAGGVCVMGSPAPFFEFSKQNALSHDGHCRSYSQLATGTLWGEGAGIFMLEKTSRAQQLGHQVYAQINGCRIGHGGTSTALAVPKVSAQEQIIRKTLAAANIAPEKIQVIEGHGTGTKVGDAVELEALNNTYGSVVDRDTKVVLGSIKSNLGHAQAASGALGLAKLLVCAEKGFIVPTLHAEQPAEKIDWSVSSLRLADSLTKWPDIDGYRYGAVSSFGVAGTNAHAIVSLPADQEVLR